MVATSSARSLMPREHGAYGQLAVPLLTALLSTRPTTAALLYTAAGVFAFCAHEPLLVLLGQRGSRALREAGRRARIRLVVLAVGALLCAGFALVLSSSAARLAFIAPASGMLAFGLLIWRKQERTDWGEIMAACILSAAAVPVAIAAGLPEQLALSAWGAFAIGFGLVTLALHRAIHGRGGTARRTVGAFAIPSLLLCGCWFFARNSATVAAAAVPMVGIALGLFVFPPSPMRLRQVGWMLVLGAVATGLLLVRAAHMESIERGIR